MHDLLTQKNASWRMFDAIAKRYDLLNRILSLGLDKSWRNALVDAIPPDARKAHLRLFDCATGTGDLLFSISKHCGGTMTCYGMDMAGEMLRVAAKKRSSTPTSFLRGDMRQIPFAAGTFDCCTIAFGIRNVDKLNTALDEMHRCLKTGGTLLILEFSRPHNPLVRFFHGLYLSVVVPLAGGIFSGNFRAYHYLNRTIREFPVGSAFCSCLKQAGFSKTGFTEISLGIATIYTAVK
jgi:demethylmenaquinone methyltransferase/2-methoxy-6-polyprenyl-1,4-benzoquinol methylase